MKEQFGEVPLAERPLEDLVNSELVELIVTEQAKDLQPLHRLLYIGVGHWQQKALDKDIFSEYFNRLAEEHNQALNGTPADRMTFCFAQAAEMYGLAEELAKRGDKNSAMEQQRYSRAWQSMASRLTMF